MWIDFLIRANHQDNKILMESELIDIQRGSFITSLKKLAKDYRSSIGKIRHFLELLENDSMIELKTTHKYTKITLCNYDTYQNGEHTESFQNENRMKTESFQNETDKNVKNVKNGKKFISPTPEEVSEYAKSISFALDGKYFNDYYEARGWKLKNGMMKDWKAAVRTWKANEEKYGTNIKGISLYQRPVPKGTHDPNKSREIIAEAYPDLSAAEIDRKLLSNGLGF
jgi:hypothetical protein